MTKLIFIAELNRQEKMFVRWSEKIRLKNIWLDMLSFTVNI